MFLFPKKKTLAESGLLRGLTDTHSHILPGVDDGFRTLPDSLGALAELESQGVTTLWLTPHIMEDYPNTTSDLRRRFDELKQAYTGSIGLRLASENMLDALFLDRLEANDFLPHGDNADRLLVETSYFNPPRGMKDILARIQLAGYQPILAHPERYVYMEEKDYRDLRAKGILFQINYGSLLGFYGRTAQKKALAFHKKGLVDMLGGDLHSLGSLRAQLDAPLPRL